MSITTKSFNHAGLGGLLMMEWGLHVVGYSAVASPRLWLSRPLQRHYVAGRQDRIDALTE